MPITASLSPNLIPSLDKLSPNEIKRVMKAIGRFGMDPHSNALNLHSIKGDASGRLFSFRASDELRVLAIRLGEGKWLIEEAGHHDALYLRASTGCFVASTDGSALGFFTAQDVFTSEAPTDAARRSPRPKPTVHAMLAHWTDAEMADVGFSSLEVSEIRAALTIDDLLDLDIDEEKIMLAIDLSEITPEKYQLKLKAPKLVEVAEEAEPLVQAMRDYGSAWGFSDFLSGEELTKLLESPIENWMVFLHPAQQEIVDRVYAGPARIGGSAGTGKTVVALHRAASLARKFSSSEQPTPILFTTYIKSLPPYFEKLYNLLPKSVPNGVRFIHVDGLASELCRRHGVTVRLNQPQCDELFSKAFSAVVTEGSAIAKSKIGADYVREEIDAVIRGRMVPDVDAYLELDRTGRKTPLQAPTRRQVWKIYERYTDFKGAKGIADFIDVIAEALEISKRLSPQYRSVIIDEAQDLSLMSLQLLRNLVNGASRKDPEDGMLLVGDGAQRVYASCFTLSQAGLQVRGRSTILTKNYRNTKEILEAAMAVTGDREVDDLGDVRSTKIKVSSALPPGSKPRLVVTESVEERTSYIANRITELVGTAGMNFGDVGVLGTNGRLVGGLAFGLSKLGLPMVQMKDDHLLAGNHVRIGTFHRSKGLEFKAVFLVGLESYPTRIKRGEGATTYEDRHELELNVTFVAMTRAREMLELVCKGEASATFQNVNQYFEVLRI